MNLDHQKYYDMLATGEYEPHSYASAARRVTAPPTTVYDWIQRETLKDYGKITLGGREFHLFKKVDLDALGEAYTRELAKRTEAALKRMSASNPEGIRELAACRVINQEIENRKNEKEF